MVTQSRRKSIDLIEELQSAPYSFNFFQAIRLLEKNQLTKDVLDNKTEIHFKANHGLSFNGADITHIECNGNIWNVDVALMGLTGSQGVLPYHFSELITAELRARSTALKDFTDIFNHRAIYLFYEAWKKYQLPVAYETERLQHKEDLLTGALLSICGLGGKETRYRTALSDESNARFAAHLGRNVCSVEFLRSSINEMFGLEIEIEQFKGEWFDLDEDSYCRLPSSKYTQGINNSLGVNTVLGQKCFQVQNRFSLIIIPRDEQEFERCSPGSTLLEKLKSFVHLSVGPEQDFDIEVRVLDDFVCLKDVCNPNHNRMLLGWNTVISPSTITKKSLSIKLSQDIGLQCAENDSLNIK